MSSKTTTPLSKADLKAQLLDALNVELAGAETAYATTRAGATHEEAKPENDKDTRALELSYLARGQAQRVDDLRGAVADVEAMPLPDASERVVLGTVIEVSNDQKVSTYFMASHGGGAKLAGGAVQAITPKAPLGRALLGKCVDDECEAILAGKPKILTVVSIR